MKVYIFLQIAHGSIIRSHTMEIKKKTRRNSKELLLLNSRTLSIVVKEIIVPFPVDLGEHNSKVTVPQRQ
jgi:excinuclease ABC subunit C